MKTNLGLVEYCYAQLGLPYWYGTFGQKGTEALYNRLATQTNTKKETLSFAKATYEKDYGKKVHDCSGLIKGYMFCDNSSDFAVRYDIQTDTSVDYDQCTEKGTIDTMPEIKGLLVFMPGHVGVYIGNGEVIEAKGHLYGVVKTQFKGRGWTKWGKYKMITYIEEDKKMTKEQQIALIKEKIGIDDNTIKYLQFYKYGDALIEKIAKALINK